MKSRRLQSTVLIAIALLIAVVFVSLAQTADHPLAAAGIGLQTLTIPAPERGGVSVARFVGLQKLTELTEAIEAEYGADST